MKVKEKPIILEIRERLGWTQDRLARALNVTQAQISYYELPKPWGTKPPIRRLQTLKKICEKEGVKLDWDYFLRDYLVSDEELGLGLKKD